MSEQFILSENLQSPRRRSRRYHSCAADEQSGSCGSGEFTGTPKSGSAGWRAYGWRAAVLAALIALALWLATRILLGAFARYVASSDPHLALSLDPTLSTALVAKARSDIKASNDPDARAAADLLRQALVANPLEARALVLLATISDAEGNRANTRALMEASSTRSRRDYATDLWLAQADLQDGALGAALAHIDNLLRIHPTSLDQLMPALSALMAIPAGRDAIADQLARNPPWRSDFLQSLDAASSSVSSQLSALFERVAEKGEAISANEMAWILSKLVQANQAGQARNLWARFALSTDGRVRLGDIYNGDFRFPLTYAPFDWRWAHPSGYEIAPRELVSGAPAPRGLTIYFPGGRTRFKGPNQYLVLTPGTTYRLSGDAAGNLVTQRGLEWVLLCPTNGWKAPGRTQLFRGNFAWTTFETILTVPADCPVQLLQLNLAARIPSEEEISGRVSFTNLAITPVN